MASRTAGAVGPEARVASLNRQPQHGARVGVADLRDRAPQRRPVGDRAARHVPRADREVGTAGDRPHEVGQRGRIVGEVGVHLDQHVVALGEPGPEPGAVRGAEALLARAPQHLDVAQRRARARRPGRRCRRGCRRRRRARSRRGGRAGSGAAPRRCSRSRCTSGSPRALERPARAYGHAVSATGRAIGTCRRPHTDFRCGRADGESRTHRRRSPRERHSCSRS